MKYRGRSRISQRGRQPQGGWGANPLLGQKFLKKGTRVDPSLNFVRHPIFFQFTIDHVTNCLRWI